MNKFYLFLIALVLSSGAFSQTGLISFSVTQNPPPATPTITASNNSIICQGGFVTLTSSSPTGNNWSNGATSQSTNVNTAGSYSVTVTLGACSSTSNPITVTSTSISISVNITNPSCGASNGSITATINGGQTPYNVQWSNGDFGLTADSLAPGQYVVQVTDANGCYSSLTVNLNPSNGPSVTSTSQNNVTCNGGSNGSIALNISGGSPPINILWSNGATTPTVSNLTAGVYDVVVTDASGCVVNASYNITEPSAVSVGIGCISATCGTSNGSISATPTGGTLPYTYLWSANANSQTTPTATNLSAGIYSVQVTDNAGCIGTGSGPVATTNAGPAITSVVTPAGGCGNLAGGSIDVTLNGGVGPYNFLWSNGATNEDISGLSPGSYVLVATGSNGCSTADTIDVVNASGNTNPEICIVTVDSFTNTNKVIWEKPGSANGIQEYKIYREGSALNVYNLIKTLPFDSLSEYTDPVANPAVRAWRYKITYKDSCGVETVLSPNHKTIHLAVNVGISNTRNLAWDDYEGFPFLTFNIWRYHASTGWVKLDSLPSNLHSYTDLNPPGGGTLDYAIEVVRPNSCNSTRGVINTTRSNVRNIVAPLSTGINELSMSGVRIYPNPTQNLINMDITTNQNSKMSVSLLDVRGREIMRSHRVLTSGKNTETFNISEIESGVYFVCVQVDDKIIRTKIVKE
ncbi:MAG: T9SS type A sorting domain-containing protein [Bacteroidota bacterium]